MLFSHKIREYWYCKYNFKEHPHGIVHMTQTKNSMQLVKQNLQWR